MGEVKGEWVGWGRGEREASACSHYRLRTRKRVATNIKVSFGTAEVGYTDAHTAWSSSGLQHCPKCANSCILRFTGRMPTPA